MQSFRSVAFLLAVLLGACGGDGRETSESSSSATLVQETSTTRKDLTAFLTAHSTAKVHYWPSWEAIPARFAHLNDRLDRLPINGATVGLFSIEYENTNLPQLTLHIRRPGNTRLLVYNHGHGGLPSAQESFATDFLGLALEAGHDLLITSLPLVGLNAIPATPVEPFYIKARDYQYPVAVDPTLLTSFFSQHALYEVIDDTDHYLHFFIDGAVIPSGIASAVPRSHMKGITQATPYVGPRYQSVNYVGLSGGATSGLPACALQTFDRCLLIAGVMPDYLRVSAFNNFGDVEQQARSFYEHFSVPDLMAIAASHSTLTMIYNRNDTCCFADPAASQFKVDFPDYDIRVTDLGFHGYDPNHLLSLLSGPQQVAVLGK